jgi:hypothetical protein
MIRAIRKDAYWFGKAELSSHDGCATCGQTPEIDLCRLLEITLTTPIMVCHVCADEITTERAKAFRHKWGHR